LNTLMQDIRYAIRGVMRAPFLSLSVVLALAVGVGLNAAVFALLDSTWLQPPVDKSPSTFVRVIPSYSGWFDTEKLFATFSVNDYNAIRSRAKSLGEVAAYTRILRASLDRDSSANAGLGLVSCNFFDVYGWGPPVKGRLFLPEECASDSSAPVAIMNESLWRNRYASDANIIGRVIRIDQRPYTVIGVANVQTVPWMREDLWVPYTMTPAFSSGADVFQHADSPAFFLAGRLNPGYSRARAQAELQLIEEDQDHIIPGRKTTVSATNGSLIQDPNTRSQGLMILWLIMGPMALILLVACTNVTMLLLARAAGRRSEMAIRLSLGAGRGRLLRMLATEGLLVAAAAGVLGAYAASELPPVLWKFLLSQSGFQTVGPDWRVFVFLAVITLLAGCIAGLAPGRESLKVNLVESLKGQEGASTARSRSRTILIVAQMAMSFVLIAGGVLFIRLQRSIASTDPGFETRRVFLVPLQVSAPRYTTQSAAAFYRSVRERVRELPGVRSVSYTDTPPLSEPPDTEIHIPGETKGQGQRAVVEQVSTEFFSTLRIRILRGRAFQDSDAAGSGGRAVAVVSQSFARNFWGAQNPVGKVVLQPDGAQLIVVGVASDVESSNFDTPNLARLYVPQSPEAFTGFLLVRFEGPANSIGERISRAVHGLDSTQTASPITLQSMLDDKAARIRPLTELVLMMAVVAMVLAISGLYGTVAFSMSQRKREFGIRMALGASKQRILRSVLLASLRQIAIGLLFGILLAIPGTLLMRNLLGNNRLFDWSTYAIAALALAVSAVCACYLPARRASRVDPMVALRYE
jgi:putative ABC transport system permease protein